MVIIAALIEVLILRPLSCLILSLIIMVKRKVKSKEIMMREIEEVKEELGLNQSNAKDVSEDQQIEQQSEFKSVNLDKYSRSHDLEQSKQSVEEQEAAPVEEEKIETKKQEDEMMKQLKEEAYIDKLSQRPQYKQPKPKRESKSEAAKIARYNLKLLESIYQAYDPEQADNVVRVFRKGGVFSVEPIMEEDFEESFDSTQQDIESQGGTDVNTGLIVATTKSSGKDVNRYLKQNSLTAKNRMYGGKDKLGDIKEENSQLLEEMFDEDEGIGDKMAYGAQSEQTGFDFDDLEGNGVFHTLNDDPEGFNALVAIAGVNDGTAAGNLSGNKTGNKTGKNKGKNTGKNAGKNSGKNSGKNTGKNSGMSSGKHAGKNTGRNTERNAINNLGNSTGKNATTNIGINSGKNVGDNAADSSGRYARINAGIMFGDTIGNIENLLSPKGTNDDDNRGNRTKGKHNMSDSFDFEDETIMGGATLNRRKKNRKRKIKKKQKDTTNYEKIRQLEGIYTSTPIIGGGSVRVSKTFIILSNTC
jgi:hypothetical protein